ncbi:MAG: TonB-dependent receptor, partial [Sulfurovum sp.]
MNNTIKLSMAVSMLLTIAVNAAELEPITIVSANKSAQSIENTTSNVSVITAEEIEANGYQTVAEALSSVAGITFSQSGGMGTQTSLFLRGMKTEKILVLLDGISLNNPSSTDGQAFFEHISLDNIEQIEVIKGGTSSIWGADASAGVINIITKKAPEGVHGDIGIT